MSDYDKSLEAARAALVRLMPYPETHALLDAFEAAIRAEAVAPHPGDTPDHGLGGTHAWMPVGAYVASALMAANIECDSGEDVDRFLAELARRGFAIRAEARQAQAETGTAMYAAACVRLVLESLGDPQAEAADKPPDPTYDPFCDDCDGLRERSDV